MRSSRDILHPPTHPAVSALIVRSEINVRRSRALVASADALVRATRRIDRPKTGGDGCGDGIGPHETEFELDFGDTLLLRFHRDCFRTWQSFDGERR